MFFPGFGLRERWYLRRRLPLFVSSPHHGQMKRTSSLPNVFSSTVRPFSSATWTMLGRMDMFLTPFILSKIRRGTRDGNLYPFGGKDNVFPFDDKVLIA